MSRRTDAASEDAGAEDGDGAVGEVFGLLPGHVGIGYRGWIGGVLWDRGIGEIVKSGKESRNQRSGSTLAI